MIVEAELVEAQPSAKECGAPDFGRHGRHIPQSFPRECRPTAVLVLLQ